MEMHPLNDIDGQARATPDSRSALRWMSSEQLLDLGMNQVVYLKSGTCEGKCSSCFSAPTGRLS